MGTWKEYMEQGGDYIDDDSCKKAIEMFNKALSLSKTNEEFAEAYYGRAFASYENRDNAIADYKMAADYGHKNALEQLKKYGISYTPKKL